MPACGSASAGPAWLQSTPSSAHESAPCTCTVAYNHPAFIVSRGPFIPASTMPHPCHGFSYPGSTHPLSSITAGLHGNAPASLSSGLQRRCLLRRTRNFRACMALPRPATTVHPSFIRPPPMVHTLVCSKCQLPEAHKPKLLQDQTMPPWPACIPGTGLQGAFSRLGYLLQC